MTDREKVINELVEHIESALAIDSDYVDCVRTDLLQYTVALLKEHEPVKPIDDGEDSYACDKCGEIVGWDAMDVAGIDPVKFKYCPGCGRKVKWNE